MKSSPLYSSNFKIGCQSLLNEGMLIPDATPTAILWDYDYYDLLKFRDGINPSYFIIPQNGY